MTLAAGTRMGVYEIVALLGAGGMGEVYRARDTRLGREVALKILPDAVAGDSERLARFQREAQLLAALVHPNVAGIHEIEETAGVWFLAMELVEGPTLEERLRAGALPVEEAFEVCRQIAEGLEAAHERGIIHRDLKPANLKITPEGKVKILDFGLAKDVSVRAVSGPTQSPTLSLNATQAGFILGTAAYMSPEQARGKTVDRRTDIWALGCVLYECLTGKQVFGGETITDILGAVVHKQADWSALPAATPRRVRDLLARMLDRDPRRRLRDAGEARIALETALAAPEPAEPAAALAPPPARWRILPWVLCALLAAAVAVALWSPWRPGPVKPQVVRLTITLPPELFFSNRIGSSLAISPDGTRLVYAAGGTPRRLFLRPIDQFEARPIADTETALSPFFSPDGEWIGFTAGNRLRKVSVTGGAALTLYEGSIVNGPRWGADDWIYVHVAGLSAARPGLGRIPAAGGKLENLTQPDTAKGETAHRWPEVLPGGKALLFAVATGGSFDASRIALLDLQTRQWRTLVEGGTNPRYLPTGHILYARSKALFAVPFDLGRLEITGSPVPALEGIGFDSYGGAPVAVTRDGSIAYATGDSDRGEKALVWVDRNGKAQPALPIERPFEDLTLSPDGGKAALSLEPAPRSVWICDFGRGALTRLTFDTLGEDPFWTPDGRRVLYNSRRDDGFGLFWRNADGTGGEERLTTHQDRPTFSHLTPDGKTLIFGIGGDIWAMPMTGDRKAQPLWSTPSIEFAPALSPDGRFLAYESNESGRNEVYVRSFPDLQGRWLVSTGGGRRPVWARSGRELFYREGTRLLAVPISTERGFQHGQPALLFEGPYLSTGHDYDVSPDGKRFLFIKPLQAQSQSDQIYVVLNWAEELRGRLAPVRK